MYLREHSCGSRNLPDRKPRHQTTIWRLKVAESKNVNATKDRIITGASNNLCKGKEALRNHLQVYCLALWI
jgi:hypothetical protein